jgi:hypothetical protein
MSRKLDKARLDHIKKQLKFVEDEVGRMSCVRHADDPNGLYAVQLVRATFRELFRFSYPETKWMNGGLIQRNTSINEGATEYSYTELQQTGRAQIVADNATDLPSADVNGRNNILPIKTVGISCTYSRQDVRTARMNGMFDIVQEKVAAAREGHDRTLDDFILFGVPAHGLRGVVRQPGIIVQNAVNGAWTEATAAADIIEDIRTALNSIMDLSDAVEVPNTALFPVAAWNLLNRRIETGTDATILSYLRTAFPMITRWEWNVPLRLADQTGTGPAALFYRNDPMRMRAVFPMMMTPIPPEQRGLAFKLNFETRFGGVMTPRPRSVLRLDGI